MAILCNQYQEPVNDGQLLIELCKKLTLLHDGGKKIMEVEYQGDLITLTVMQKGWDKRDKKTN